MERIRLPDALLRCPPDPERRPAASQKDAAIVLEIAMAALRACRANMEAVKRLNDAVVAPPGRPVLSSQ